MHSLCSSSDSRSFHVHWVCTAVIFKTLEHGNHPSPPLSSPPSSPLPPLFFPFIVLTICKVLCPLASPIAIHARALQATPPSAIATFMVSIRKNNKKTKKQKNKKTKKQKNKKTKKQKNKKKQKHNINKTGGVLAPRTSIDGSLLCTPFAITLSHYHSFGMF